MSAAVTMSSFPVHAICVCVCMWADVRACVHPYIYVCVCVSMCLASYGRIHVGVDACMPLPFISREFLCVSLQKWTETCSPQVFFCDGMGNKLLPEKSASSAHHGSPGFRMYHIHGLLAARPVDACLVFIQQRGRGG